MPAGLRSEYAKKNHMNGKTNNYVEKRKYFEPNTRDNFVSQSFDISSKISNRKKKLAQRDRTRPTSYKIYFKYFMYL